MPMHDWTRVKAGTYHSFRFSWIVSIMDRLNSGLLPKGFFAMADQILGETEPNLIALKNSKGPFDRNPGPPAVATKPRFRSITDTDKGRYARKTNRIAIHHELGDVVAVIDIVSPGTKDGRKLFSEFIGKSADLLIQGVNILVIDPFPPGPRDPNGIHAAIWSELTDVSTDHTPKDKPLTIVSYQAYPVRAAYLEFMAVGDPVPPMPLYLAGEYHVEVPLEETYQTTWEVLPKEVKLLFSPSAS